jgi:SanA protein
METQFKQHGAFSKFKWRWVLYFIVFVVWISWLINLWILNERRYIVFDCIRDIDPYPVALVLGAAVTNEGNLGYYFIDRLDKAIKLYEAGQVKKILVAGQGGRYAYNEIEPAKDYLLKNKVAQEDIFLDYNSKNTFASMYRAKHLYNIDRALIISQDFHLPRSLYLARRLKIDSFGCVADSVDYMEKTEDRRREFFARVKAWLDINLNVSLTLSETSVDISGDGRQTWMAN